jgi:hypothetical protein
VTDGASGDTGYFANPNRAFHAGPGITGATVLDGFTINGGGGVYSSAVSCCGGSPMISNNTIHGGSGSSRSYGVYVNESSPFISGNVIDGGSGGVYTYGLCCVEASARAQGNVIDGGGGSTGSHGVDLYYSSAEIAANSISGGWSSGASFGVMITGASPVLYNNVIRGQGSSPVNSWGICFGAAGGSDRPYIASNTIDAGQGTMQSCGIEITSSRPDIVNNIIVVTGGIGRYGIYEMGADPSSVENNDVHIAPGGSFSALYYDDDTGTGYNFICSGNFGPAGCASTMTMPAGVNNVSADPALDGSCRLTASTPESVSRGGKTLTLFTSDRIGVIRTASWSMGAFERD